MDYEYRFKKWIEPIKLDIYQLNTNPNAVQYLSQNQDFIVWHRLSRNPAAKKFINDRFK